MGKLDRYKINLKNQKEDHLSLEFKIDDDFFKELESQDIQGGQVVCLLDIKQSSGNYILSFHSEGSVKVICDRCLDEMELPVDAANHLTVKFGPEASDEGDEVVTVAEDEGVIDVAWYIYEFIMLSLPIQHVHEEGTCNEGMMAELNKHAVSDDKEEDQSGEEETDPRWNELKKIMNNN